MYGRAAARYRDVDLESAPKTQIVERLFARFERDVELARAAIAAKDIAGKAAAIDHATQIVVSLRGALDHHAAPELCVNLDALYRFVIDKLTSANRTLDAKHLDAACGVMRKLGESFRKAHATL